MAEMISTAKKKKGKYPRIDVERREQPSNQDQKLQQSEAGKTISTYSLQARIRCNQMSYLLKEFGEVID